MYTLWHRRTRYCKWRRVFTGPTSQACTDQIGVVELAGDWFVGQGDQDPNRKVPRMTAVTIQFPDDEEP